MENSINSINQTAPAAQKPKRTINRPHVGVVDVPNLSRTPIKDELVRKAQENPREIFNFKTGKKKNLNFQAALSGIIGGCGLLSILNFIKKTKH